MIILYTYENLKETNFIEYLKFIQSSFETITFRTINQTMVIRLKINELLDEDSVICTLLKKWPDKKFFIDNKMIENSFFDLSDIFVKEYIEMLSIDKKRTL